MFSFLIFQGTEEMRQEVAPSVLQGQKFIALAISEPQAGSDVAGMVHFSSRILIFISSFFNSFFLILLGDQCD